MLDWFNGVTRSQTNILQQRDYNKNLLSQIEQIAETWQQPKPAVTAAEQLEHQGKLASIIPPPCRHKAHSSHRGHVLRGERWQLLSNVIITHSQTSWNKDATKDPVEMGPAMPRAHTYERAMKHHAQVCTISHLDSESRTPHWLARRKWVKNRDRDTKMIDFKRFLKNTRIVYACVIFVSPQ